MPIPPAGGEPETPFSTADELVGGNSLARALHLRRGEGRLILLAAAYHFFLMASYFIVKPLREEMGVQGGARNLKYLWAGTLITSLAVLPPYWKLVSKLPRRRFIPIVYRAVLVTLVLFYGLMRWAPHDAQIWVARAFYVWVSVFNLFVLSVFWAFMADAFTAAQGRRLFGLLAAGGTTGALSGAWLTSEYAAELKATGLVLVSAGLLECATQCAQAFGRKLHGGAVERPPAQAPRTSLWKQWTAGFDLLARSPYLLGVVGYLFLSTFASSFVYAQRTEIMGAQLKDSALRTAVFGWSEFATQGLAFLGQTLLSARLLRWAGTGRTLMTQIVVAIGGFLVLAWALHQPQAPIEGTAWWSWLRLPLTQPSAALLAVVLFQVLLKATEYGLSKPARESLFTVVSRSEKYQCKSLIDTGLYRFFDQVHIWSYAFLHETTGIALGWSLRACAFATGPVLLLGLWLAPWLGRRQAELAKARATSGPAGSEAS